MPGKNCVGAIFCVVLLCYPVSSSTVRVDRSGREIANTNVACTTTQFSKYSCFTHQDFGNVKVFGGSEIVHSVKSCEVPTHGHNKILVLVVVRVAF